MKKLLLNLKFCDRIRNIKLKYIIFLFFFTPSFSHSQWINISNTPMGTLRSHSFIDSKTGWACGYGGVIIHTINGGANWYYQNSNTINNLSDIKFINENTGWACSDSLIGIIIKTTNGGANWFTQYTVDFLPCGFSSIFFLNNLTGWACGDRTGRGSIWCRTTDGGNNWYFLGGGSGGYIYTISFSDSYTGWFLGWTLNQKTTDGGSNWFTMSNGDSSKRFVSMQMVNNNTGWFIRTDSVFKTTNGGNNFLSQSLPVSTNNLSSVAFKNNNTGYVTSNNGYVLKTINAGNNWLLDTVLSGNPVKISYPNQNVGFITTNYAGMYRNLYFGAILNNITRIIGRNTNTNISLSDSSCIGTIDSMYWYVNDSLVNRQHSFTYNFKQGTSLVKLKISNNSGQIDSTVSRVTVCVYKKYTAGQIKAGYSLIGDSVFYVVSTNNAVYKMDINGNIIYSLMTGGSILSECSISYDTNVYITSTDNNLYGFKNDGSNLWPPIPLGNQATTTPTIDSVSNNLYIGVSNGFFRAINRVNGNGAWSYFCNAPVRSSAVLSSSRKLVVASAIGTVYGFNLNLPSPSPPSWVLNLNDSILVSPAIDTLGYFYFGSRSGKIYKVALQGTTNASVIWQQTLGSPVTSSPVIDANSNLYAGTANGKLYSLKISNGNINWNFQTDSAIRSTPTITPYGRIYFGNDKGEVFGIDTSRNIKFYFIDSAKVSCSMLYGNGTLYFGNEMGRLFAFYDTTAVLEKTGKGVPIWGTFQNNARRTGSQRDGAQSIGIQKISDIIPNKFELYQNYPNPFNPSTIIKFSIPSRTVILSEVKNPLVTLKIYDILGREVVTLVNEKLHPGVYEIQFSNNQFASGVYFYKLVTGEFIDVKKMTLIK